MITKRVHSFNNTKILKNIKISRYINVFIVVLLVVFSSFMSSHFLTVMNIANILRQNAGMLMLSMGMLLVILSGGIDLSVGSMVALSSVLLSKMLVAEISLFMAVVFLLLIFIGIGLIEGYFVAKRGIAPFIVTLAFMTIARGAAFSLSAGAAIQISEKHLLSFGSQYFMKMPYPVWLAFGMFIIFAFFLKYTVYGRYVKGIGSNFTAVELSGINVDWYKLSVYMVSASMCAIAGILVVARSGVGTPITGEGLELDAIAAVVIGGASLKGGKGTALNTLMGILILALLGNIMNLMNIASYPQQILKGIIILVAVLFQKFESETAS